MAKNKTSEKKKYLSREINKNERAPVWVYLKTKTREWIQGRTRHWRSGKLGKKIKKKQRMSEKYVQKTKPTKRVGAKKKKSKK